MALLRLFTEPKIAPENMTIGDIQTKIYNLTNTNSSSFPDSDMLIDINIAYNQITTMIMEADGRWQWDDTGRSDLPIATTDINNGQRDYSMAAGHLEIDRVEVLDKDDNWVPLQPFDEADLKRFRLAWSELANESGVPWRYDVIGESIFLDPVPDYDKTAGLKTFIKRGPLEFTSSELTTGTKEPGFASTFHHLIPYMVARDYELAHNKASEANSYDAIVERDSRKLKDFYAKRHRDHKPVMTPSGDSTIRSRRHI